MAAIALILLCLLQGEVVFSQISPLQFLIPAEGVSINGSSTVANCSQINPIQFPDTNRSVCDAPNSSVLFDGTIPTLTGLDGNQWANHLYIANTEATLISSFAGTPGYNGIGRFEVVLFNCSQYSTGFQSISVRTGNDFIELGPVEMFIVPSPLQSCQSLVRVCFAINITASLTHIGLQFTRASNAQFIHLAEVTFDGSTTSSCPPDMILTPAPTTVPPSTEPPSTEPPSTEPPSTEPPSTTAPITTVQPISRNFVLDCEVNSAVPIRAITMITIGIATLAAVV